MLLHEAAVCFARACVYLLYLGRGMMGSIPLLLLCCGFQAHVVCILGLWGAFLTDVCMYEQVFCKRLWAFQVHRTYNSTAHTGYIPRVQKYDIYPDNKCSNAHAGALHSATNADFKHVFPILYEHSVRLLHSHTMVYVVNVHYT